MKSDQAIGGLEGLAMIKQRFESQTSMYTLLLIDYSMPSLDGPSLTVEIAKFLEEKGIDMPLVCCCTAYAEENYQQTALRAGMKKFLTKPVSDDDIHALILEARLK